MKENGQDNTEYVTSSVGMRILGVERGTFFYYVDKEDIEVEPGGTKRKNRYKLADILKLKEKRKKERIERAKKKLEPPALIDWIYAGDLPAGIALAQRRYDIETVDLAEQVIYEGWRKNNAHLSLAAFSQDRRECYASIQLVPLPEQVILDVLSNRRNENSIQPSEIRGYDEPGPYTLLATSVICLPERPELVFQLLRKYMEYWLEMFPARYITRIYAQAVSESGDRMTQHFFMSPRYDLADNAYMLDLGRAGASKVIRWFKGQMEKKAPLPEELQHPYTPSILPVQIAETSHQRAGPPNTTGRTRSQKEPLPSEYVSAEGFSKDHGIAPTTMRTALTSGRLQAEENNWLVGRARVRLAFNRDQQWAFIAIYRTNEHFHHCNNQDCPCQV